MKRWFFFIPLATFLGLAGFLGAGLTLDPKEVPSPLIGKPAPSFAISRLDNANTRLRNADMQGQVWMLNVWASWCTACRQEHPVLMAFSRSQQLPIYGLNYKDERHAGMAWLAHFGDPYEASLFDPAGRVGMDFGVYGVPETFIMDRHGVVRFKHTGPLTPEVLKTQIEPLLRQLRG